MDTSLLRPVYFVSEERKPLHFLQIQPTYYGHSFNMNKLTGFGVIILYQQEFDGSYYTCNLSFAAFHFGCDSECFIFDYSVSTGKEKDRKNSKRQ